MDAILRFTMIVALLVYFITLLLLLKKNKVTLKYILLWLFTGIVMLIIALFPALLEVPLHLLGVKEFTNGLFATVLFFLILIIMSLTMIMSTLSEKQRDLIQKVALYEYRLRKLEEQYRMEENNL